MSYNLDNDYDMKGSSNGLDSQISDLKTRLFDLEQQEKDFNALSQKLAQLKKEYAILTNTKNRLEQELKQKDDSYNQRISNLRAENENLQQSYNEKLALNKKLFTDNDALEKEIELRDAELNDLRNKFRDLTNHLNQSLGDKGDLENQVQKLKNINNSQLNENISFFDLISSGVRLKLSIGIDFTGSNGHPLDKDTLHCIIGNEPNDYEKVIKLVGNILSNYNNEKLYPVYGKDVC